MSEKYISLRDATKYCPYSSDYLKLRARQGKLRAIKMGRNWFTTREWLELYKNSPKSRYNNTSYGLRMSIGGLLGRFLAILLIIIILSLLLNLAESILEGIIPAKIIKIERQI